MGKRHSGGIGLNKLSFWLIVISAILYLVAMILGYCGLHTGIVSAIQAVASVVMVCIVAVLAWRYVSNKPAVWKVLYVIVLLICLVALVLPTIHWFKIF